MKTALLSHYLWIFLLGLKNAETVAGEANLNNILMQVAADINSCGGKAFFRRVDVTDKAQVSYCSRLKKENYHIGIGKTS